MSIDLSDIPFVDGHMHSPPRTAVRSGQEFLQRWYEGPREHAAAAAGLSAVRWALHQLAEFLGCDDTPDAVAATLGKQPPLGRLAEVVRKGRIEGLVIDTGHPPPDEAVDPAEIAAIAGVPVVRLLRLERLAGSLATQRGDFAQFVDRFDAAVSGAHRDGYAGLKSVIAYRSGLAVAPSEWRDAEAAFARDPGRRTGRLQEKPLLDFLLLRALPSAQRNNLPVQFHCGYGDSDIDLPLGNPVLLKGLLDSGRLAGVDIVLLHGAFPYTREAAWLAAVYPNVVLDVSACMPPVGWAGLVEIWRAALAVAPIDRIHASTDAVGMIEQVLLGALRARATLAVALGELLAAGVYDGKACESAAESILHETATRLYFRDCRI